MNQLRKDKVTERPIRVAVVMGKHVTGGIKTVIMNYYENINRNVIQFDFIVDSDSPLKDYSKIESLGGRVYEIPPVENLLGHIFECTRILKRENYLIVHGYVNTLNVFPMLAAKMAGIPVRIAENLSTAHPGERKTVIKNFLRPLAKWFPTHLAANSKYAAIWLYGRKYLPKCKILYNAIDLDKFNYDEELREFTREAYSLNGKFVVGHIGRYYYQKNHEFLIDIFNEVHKRDESAVLLLIGYGELKEDIFKKIARLQLTEYVVDLGAREDIAQFYNAMDCFVFPSFYEGLPVVGIEAQATGLPCVMSTEITSETKITDAAEFIELSEPAKVWAEKILKWKGYQRKRVDGQVAANGYNIKDEAHLLADYYVAAVEKAIQYE